MPIGRNCVEHYRQLSRYCVFSHDEMVCNMACKADSLEIDLASAVQKEMSVMVQEEQELREKVNNMVSSSCLKDPLSARCSIYILSTYCRAITRCYGGKVTPVCLLSAEASVRKHPSAIH